MKKLYWGIATLIIILIGVSVVLFVQNRNKEPVTPIVIAKPLTPEDKAQLQQNIRETIEKEKNASTGEIVSQGDHTQETQTHDKSKTPVVTTDKPVPAVSPFGFGPYPPLPPGWKGTPEGTWGNCVTPGHELLKRVRIKLLSQGVDVQGGFIDNDKVYPTIPGIVYVEWEDYEGSRYIASISGHADTVDRISAIKEAKLNRGEDDKITEGDIPSIPSDIKLVPYDEGGIEPYEFLGITP